MEFLYDFRTQGRAYAHVFAIVFGFQIACIKKKLWPFKDTAFSPIFSAHTWGEPFGYIPQKAWTHRANPKCLQIKTCHNKCKLLVTLVIEQHRRSKPLTELFEVLFGVSNSPMGSFRHYSGPFVLISSHMAVPNL